ncbi:MAG: hypothetical protein AAF587_06560 [Bacteroidota bacterium]
MILETGISLSLQQEIPINLGQFLGSVLLEGEDVRVEDSVEQKGGYVWVTRNLHLKTASVLLEGNFIDENLVTDSLLQESTINRIRIHDPAFQTSQGVGIGSTVKELIEHLGEESLGITPIPDFGYVDLQLGQSHIHFLIKDDFLQQDMAESGLQLEDLPKDHLIALIVVM